MTTTAGGVGREAVPDAVRRPPTRLPGPVVVLAVLAALARLAYLRSPLSADAAGFLTVAGQWRPGSSLYGDLWVDRPPGLVLVFELADVLGGSGPLRVLGAVAAAVAVLAAGRLGLLVTGRRAPAVAAAAVTAALVASRLLQADETNGEILAVPFVLLGLVAVAVSLRSRGRRAWWPAVAAGAAAATAASMKQNFLDVLAAGVVVLGVLLLQRRTRRAGSLLAGALLGAGGVTAVLLGLAWLRGTDPAALWDALVVFRLQAGEVISAHASAATGERARRLLGVWALTGMPLLLLALLRLRWDVRRHHGERPGRPDPTWSWVALGLLAWAGSGVVLGGSYWWHYLVGLVPGTALLVALAWPVRTDGAAQRRTAQVLVGVVVASSLATLVWSALSPPREDPSVLDTVDYLRSHGAPGETGVVAFGQPQVLRDAGLRPAYEHLWSLPARVRDPDLRDLRRVLTGPDRPDWLVVGGRSLQTWGVDEQAARRLGRVVARDYDVVHRNARTTVLRLTP